MDSSTTYNILAAVIIVAAGLVPALLFYNMVRPAKRRDRDGTAEMDMNICGVKLSHERNKDLSDLGSSAGRW